MNTDLNQGAIALQRGELRHLPHAQGLRVECLTGSLWLTIDGDPRDIVLSPGEGFTVDRRGDVIISALDASRALLLLPQGLH
ncbi:MAG: DUF2917 domain-containing protein [Burkholderiales bacterium]|nr:DUF2917 domain-containing protein [Burkholderiales bacterium]